jgi:arylsulfatase
VALVNPHDVMWYPIDQPWYAERHPDQVAFVRKVLSGAAWKEGETLPLFERSYPEIFDALPANFDDDLHAKPEAQRQWRWDQQHGFWGYIDPKDTRAWLRHLDYYAELHRLADQSLGTVLDALDDSGRAGDTIVLFTSDHGDMCGSHGLRSKGPFVYDEIMRVPLYVRAPGLVRAGTRTAALASHVDLARTIAALAGAEAPGFPGVDLSPVLRDPAAGARDAVLFALDSAHTDHLNRTRYAVRGYFDGRWKYARYYGVGGGIPGPGLRGRPQGRKLFDVDCDFDDQDHELYDLSQDPHELVNLATDRGRRREVREHFSRLRELERKNFQRPV